jgi:hypothetical protein
MGHSQAGRDCAKRMLENISTKGKLAADIWATIASKMKPHAPIL